VTDAELAWNLRCINEQRPSSALIEAAARLETIAVREGTVTVIPVDREIVCFYSHERSPLRPYDGVEPAVRRLEFRVPPGSTKAVDLFGEIMVLVHPFR
jgi:hypothetical protein